MMVDISEETKRKLHEELDHLLSALPQYGSSQLLIKTHEGQIRLVDVTTSRSVKA